MEYVKIAQKQDITPGHDKMKIFHDGKAVLVVNAGGSYYAVDDTCPHKGGSLYDGKLKGDHVICPKHGTVFDVRTGEVTTKGGMLFVKIDVDNIKTYPVKVVGEDIMIGFD